MTTADSLQGRKRFSLLKGGPTAAPGAEAASGGAWIALYTALNLAAGHGLFLAVAVTRSGLPGLRDLGGASTAPFVLFFLACIPLVPLMYFLRARFVGLPIGWQRGLAGASCLGCLVAFGGYLGRMLAS